MDVNSLNERTKRTIDARYYLEEIRNIRRDSQKVIDACSKLEGAIIRNINSLEGINN